MPEQDRPVRIERVAGPNRSLVVPVGLATILLLVLVAKPWGGTSERPGSSAPAGVASGTGQPLGAAASGPRSTPNAELTAALDRRQCHNPDLWRVVTQERSRSGETRSLFPINPVTARAPTDPAIGATTIHASLLLGLGYCIPVGVDPDVAAVERQVLIWKKVAGGRYAPVKGTRVLDRALFNLGEVYFAPAGGPQTTWAAGRYVFEIQNPVDGTARWFAVDFAPSD